jgi:hypothetical protein
MWLALGWVSCFIPSKGRDFSFLNHAETGSGAHPPFLLVGTGSSSSGIKVAEM